MKIMNTSGELSVKDKYNLTMSPKIQRIKDCEGQRIEVAKWCQYIDTDTKSGEEKQILSIMTPESEVFATNSATFQRDFEAINELLGDAGEDGTVFALEVVTGTSKAGRQFFTCAYVD